ncbi:protein bric-a-brac 1-like isoform X2 [Ornithodoros turicata]|uniref:protein bric-a-brac 1-like isoform X2 n=1 Tax=Ornithodoros turicata TaxID=34597 RepID=UPI0031388CAE
MFIGDAFKSSTSVRIARNKMGSQQFCLKWNNHQSNMLTVFEQLLSNEALVDVTLACEGLSLKAHKMVLSACSPFFQALFVENPCKHPIVILKDMRYVDLKAIVEFMYRGEVNVSQDQLSALLKTAETLKVKGLAEVTGENRQGLVPIGTTATEADAKGSTPRAESPPLSKRKRGRPRRRSPSDSNKSDSEDQGGSAVTRVKGAPESPEIIEDGSLSSDRLAVPSPAKIPATTNKVLNATAAVSTTREDSVPADDVGSPDDADFEVDASNLMEQSMTTENVPMFSEVASSSQLQESQTHHTGSSHENSALIPASLPSDISISTQDCAAGSVTGQTARTEAPFRYPGPEQLTLLRFRSQNVRQFAINVARTVFTSEEMRQSNCSGACKKFRLDAEKLGFVRTTVLSAYTTDSDEASNELWKECCRSIDAHCRHERRVWKNAIARERSRQPVKME